MARMKNGVIQRGDGKWSFVIRVEDPATGKKKPTWHSGFDTHKKAKDARERALGELQRGAWIAPDKVTLGEFLETWLASKTGAPKTIDGYRYNVEHYVIPRIGGVHLQRVTPLLLTGFYAKLLADGGRGGAPLGWPSVKSVASTLSSALGTAEKLGAIPANPARRADLPPRPHTTSRNEAEALQFDVLTPSQVAIFAAHVVAAHRLGAFFHLAAFTGARRGELLHLRWVDVDFDAAQLHIRGSRTVVADRSPTDDPGVKRKRIVVDGPTKTKRQRTISLDRGTVAAMRQHRQRQREDRLAAGELWHDADDFVFRTVDGRPLWPETPTQLMRQMCAGSGVPRIKLHELRHTHATILLNAGVPVHEVAARLGHTDVHETLNTYARVIRSRSNALGDQFAAALAAPS